MSRQKFQIFKNVLEHKLSGSIYKIVASTSEVCTPIVMNII